MVGQGYTAAQALIHLYIAGTAAKAWPVLVPLVADIVAAAVAAVHHIAAGSDIHHSLRTKAAVDVEMVAADVKTAVAAVVVVVVVG
jgi:hypothetical protein